MKSFSKLSIFFIFAIFTITACRSGNTSSTQTPEPVPPTALQNQSGEDPYPVPVEDEPIPYPQPEEQTSVKITPGPTPTIVVGTGKLIGQMLLSGEPVSGTTLYLAEILKNPDGEDLVAAMDRLNSPRAYSDETGSFTFFNVPPGKYGVILDVVQDSYLLHYPSNNEQIIVMVNADEITDLGVLDFEDLPTP